MNTTAFFQVLKKVNNNCTLEHMFDYGVNKTERFFEILIHTEPSEKIMALCQENGFSVKKNRNNVRGKNGEFVERDVWEVIPIDSNDIQYVSDETMAWRNNNIFLAMTTAMQMAYATDEGKMVALKRLMASLPEKETIIFCRFVKSQQACKELFPEATVMSLQKEALGLNLQQFSRMVFFDRVWDYALILQASRRTFRTGQEHDCHYYEMTGDVGLDRMMEKNIRKKITMSEYLKKVSLEEIRRVL